MAANPRAAAVAALVRQEQDGFPTLFWMPNSSASSWKAAIKLLPAPSFYTVLEHRGTLDYILCQFLPKGLAKAGCTGARDPACRAGTGPLYAGAGIGSRQ